MRSRPIILLADDSEAFLMYLSVLLQRMGFDVIAAEDGGEVLKLMKIVMPDLVMLDITMPVMDGFTTLKQIKSDNQISGIPVVMVTADKDEKTYEKCVQLKCSGFLTKPIKLSEMNDVMQESMTISGGKRRKFLRASLRKKVMIASAGDGSSQEYYAVSLSEGGMYVRKREPFPVGTDVEISLQLTEERTLYLKGTVIYQKGLYGDMLKIAPGMGILFKDIPANDSSILRAYITELLTGDILKEQEEEVIASHEHMDGISEKDFHFPNE